METDQEVQALKIEVERLTESLNTRALDYENIGWTQISGYAQDDDGMELDSLKGISEKLRELAATNPLHIRGAQLRHSYVFGRGVGFYDLKPQAQKIIADPHNKSVLFSVEAYETNNLAVFTDGNLFVTYRPSTKRFNSIPLSEITGVVTDDDDNSVIQYVQRSWTSNKTPRIVWYPVSRFKKSNSIAKTITSGPGAPPVPVDQDAVMYLKQTKRQTGWTWGVPDSMGAFLWTLTYTGYLRDSAQLVNALSRFAFTLTRSSSAGVDKAAAQVKQPGVGGTAIMGEGSALSGVGVPSAQVNFGHGQPLAALVATSFGVPVIALLSSPGATGGSYGAASTLDAPTIQGFEAVQDSWVSFYEEILNDLGSKDAKVEFPAIQNDPNYRQITSIELGRAGGVIWDDEARGAYLDILDVRKLHDGLPPKPEIVDTVSKQGVSGAVPGGSTDNGDTNNDNADSDKPSTGK